MIWIIGVCLARELGREHEQGGQSSSCPGGGIDSAGDFRLGIDVPSCCPSTFEVAVVQIVGDYDSTFR